MKACMIETVSKDYMKLTKMIGELIGIGGREVVGKMIGEWNR